MKEKKSALLAIAGAVIVAAAALAGVRLLLRKRGEWR